MTDRNETYTIPGHLAIALQSGRGELAQLYVNEVEKGHEIPKEQLIEIVRLVGDMINDNRKLRHENEVLRTLFNEFKSEIKEKLQQIDFARNGARKLLREMQQQVDELDED